MPWPVHPNGLLGAQGDNDTYQISRSLRFNSADNTNLNRTFSTPTSQNIYTLSMWVKRTSFGTIQNIFSFSTTSALYFNASDQLALTTPAGTGASAAVFRDPSAWYHIVYYQSGTTILLYVNGIAVASGSLASSQFNTAAAHHIGINPTPSQAINAYITEIYFIDGQALTPSSFAETDAITGRWKAKAYSGTYGTNGFYLKFADNSGTTSTTLGKDSSPNGNNWTPNNFSVTAGAGNDSLVDSPTNYGSDTGVGGELRGNYCTLNPLKNYAISLTNGNLDGASNTSTRASIYGTVGVSSGKWYWEVTQNSVTGVNALAIGIANENGTITDGAGATSNEWIYYGQSGQKVTNNILTAYGASFTTGDTIGVAFDADAGTLVFYKNNTSQGTAFTSLTSGPYFPAIGDGGNSNAQSWSANFGQRPFAYTAPTGFKALCTTNLPTPTIKKPSSYFDVVTRTSDGASNYTKTGLGFSPDLIWTKDRTSAYDHVLWDTTRGTQKYLNSNTTSTELTAGQLASFNSDGYTINYGMGQANFSTDRYVDLIWDEATISGMDIVGYVGDGNSGRAISHSLGVTPKMIIVKNRTTTSDWPVYHSSLAANNIVFLHLTQAQAAISTLAWGGVSAASSTTFTVTVGATDIRNVNKSGDNYIAYCFAEVEGFSKFGSYTGNASADGPFIYCGFRPKLIIGKRIDAVENWIIYDTSRDSFNVASAQLQPNTSIAETTANSLIDFNSNGFKFRSTNSFNGNSAGGTHIFMAFAESPFKYARAR